MVQTSSKPVYCMTGLDTSVIKTKVLSFISIVCAGVTENFTANETSSGQFGLGWAFP